MHLLVSSANAVGIIIGGILLLLPRPCATLSTTNCTLCDDGAYPSDPGARYRLDEDNTFNCSQLFHIAPTLTDADDCSGIRQIGKTICRCNPEEVPPCTLCYDGTGLPNPDAEVLPGRTCADLEKEADEDFESNCPYWQATAGVYCNCSNAELDILSCRICPGKMLPTPSRMVTFTNGDSKSCMELEIAVNRNDGDCGRYQQLYAEECGCFDSENDEKPPSPTPSSAHKSIISRRTNRLMITAGVFGWISFHL